MTSPAAPPPKPLSVARRPELTRLPPLGRRRRAFRRLVLALGRVALRLWLRPAISGREQLPAQGPMIVAMNHLGDADVAVILPLLPPSLTPLAKVELHALPLLGRIMDAYGVIWVHRGQPDRRAIAAALAGLAEGRLIAIAPEGRQSLTGALEEGTSGAAYLALKASVPILPVTVTGTENARIYGSLRRLRRPAVTLTIGAPFHLVPGPDRREALRLGTETIMRALARQMPPAYQGAYQPPDAAASPPPAAPDRPG